MSDRRVRTGTWRALGRGPGVRMHRQCPRFGRACSLVVSHVARPCAGRTEQSIRQWVLSFPCSPRFPFATRHAVFSRVLGIVYRTISTLLVRRAGLRVGASTARASTAREAAGTGMAAEARQPAARMAETAVLVNEFGEIGIDRLLFEALDDDVPSSPRAACAAPFARIWWRAFARCSSGAPPGRSPLRGSRDSRYTVSEAPYPSRRRRGSGLQRSDDRHGAGRFLLRSCHGDSGGTFDAAVTHLPRACIRRSPIDPSDLDGGNTTDAMGTQLPFIVRCDLRGAFPARVPITRLQRRSFTW